MSSIPASTLPVPAPRFFYGWVILIACFMITTVASGTMMGFGVFINPMADTMGWSHSSLSLAYAISSLVTGIGVLIVGSVLHARSVRQIFLLSTLIHCLGIYMTSTVTSIEAFYFWYGFVASAGRSAFFMSTATLITRWFEHRRGLIMGIMMSGNGLGPFIFSPLVSWMIFYWDWQTAYLLLSINMTICLTLSCLLIRNHPADMGLTPYGGTPAVARPQPSGSAATTPAQQAPSGGSLWGVVLRMESFWSMCWINFFCCLCHSIPLVHVVSFAQHAGLSAFAAAWVLAIMNVSSIVGRIYWGMFADRHGGRLALMLTLFLQGSLILWLVNTQDPVLFFLYALLWGFGYGGVGTQYGIVSRELYGARLFGPGYSGQNGFAMVGMALGGFLGGYLYDISGSYSTSWLLSFGSGLISSLIALDLMAQGERTRTTSDQSVSDQGPLLPSPSGRGLG
ncbi:MAG: MFS transporter [Candidatus Tectomicrobia bacterium]|uniref:MFS transporter n=1 Tax=Tectimicrobiota bacterium TaxID=2528274 RepID=A0A938B2I8_UNCTE|nr:MFS transporter [Candidatus Tectomicrobia bacterium]